MLHRSIPYTYMPETTVSPLSDQLERVTDSQDDVHLDSLVSESFEDGECTWSLYVELAEGWRSSRIMMAPAVENRSGYDDHVEYRIFIKEGRIKTVVDVGRFLETVNYGGVFFVFIPEKGLLKRDKTDLFIQKEHVTK